MSEEIGRELSEWRKIPELARLLELADPPKRLFFRGEWKSSLFENCAAVVGSRKMTEYGRFAVEKLVAELVAAGKTVVSGFMYGIDQAAHNAAIEFGGGTIAVLGWGINYRLVERDRKLAEKIINSGGLLISEWENQEASLWTFPVRNRIVAALSSEVYVVEAAEKSGTQITVNDALRLGRRVFAVPGPITSRVSGGTNILISSGKAKTWTPGVQPPRLNEGKGKSVVEDLIREQGGLTADEMARILSLSVAEIGVELTHLVLMGVVVERQGRYYLT